MSDSAGAGSIAAGKRDLRFDSMRGALLVVMSVNHIGSDLRISLDHPFGFVSAAEGFVFLSGLLVGWIYGRKLMVAGAPAMRRSCWRRAGQIYLWQLAGFFGTFAWCWLAPRFSGERAWLLPALFFERPVAGALSGACLLYQPGLIDILPMYIGFMLIAPWVLRACAADRWLIAWLVSGAVWGAEQVFASPQPLVTGVINTGAFHFLAWQFLFVSGVVIGYRRFASGGPTVPPRAWLIAVAGSLAVLLWLARQAILPFWWDASDVEQLTNKTLLAPLRLINFALLAYLVGKSASVFPRLFMWPPLAFLGRHSLAAFTAQTLLAGVILTWPETADHTGWRWFNTALIVGGLYAAAAGQAWAQRLRTRASNAKRRVGAGASALGQNA